MIAHVALKRNIPNVAWVGSITNSLRVANQVIVIFLRSYKMNDVLVTVGKAVFCRFRHATIFSPNNSISDNPSIVYRRCFETSRNSRKCARSVRITDVDEYGASTLKNSPPFPHTVDHCRNILVRCGLLANLTCEAVVAFFPIWGRRNNQIYRSIRKGDVARVGVMADAFCFCDVTESG